MKKVLATNNAPAAIGPYSQAIHADKFVFVSGQLPIDPATGEFAGADIAYEAEGVFELTRNGGRTGYERFIYSRKWF